MNVDEFYLGYSRDIFAMHKRAQEGVDFLRASKIPVLHHYRECKKMLGWKPLPLPVYRDFLKRGDIAVLEWKIREARKAQNTRIAQSLRKDTPYYD